jgi:hypothetical protein
MSFEGFHGVLIWCSRSPAQFLTTSGHWFVMFDME